MPEFDTHQEIAEYLTQKKEAERAHWAAHPLPHPTVGGRPLQIGDRVRLAPGHYREGGVVTEIRVRCFGNPGDEDVKGPGFKVVGRRPMQQVWIMLDGEGMIYHEDDIAEVLP